MDTLSGKTEMKADLIRPRSYAHQSLSQFVKMDGGGLLTNLAVNNMINDQATHNRHMRAGGLFSGLAC